MGIWSETDFPYGDPISNPTLAQDVNITKPYPGVVYNGTEASAEYSETREVSGVFWSAVNATFNTGSLIWQQINGALPSTAIAINGDNTQFLTFAASGTDGATITWSTTGTIDNATGALSAVSTALSGLMHSATARVDALAGGGGQFVTTDNTGNLGVGNAIAQAVTIITHAGTGSETNSAPGTLATVSITTPANSFGTNGNWRVFVDVYVANSSTTPTNPTPIGIGTATAGTSGTPLYANGASTHLITGGNCVSDNYNGVTGYHQGSTSSVHYSAVYDNSTAITFTALLGQQSTTGTFNGFIKVMAVAN